MTPTVEIITSPVPAAGLIYKARALAARHSGNLRAPHHTASRAAIGAEMAMAAGGVLLLDEPAEFSRAVVRMIADILVRMDPACQPRVILIIRGDEDPRATASTLARCAELFADWRVTQHHTALPDSCAVQPRTAA